MCNSIEFDDSELATLVRQWIPLIHKVANKLTYIEPEFGVDDYLQDTLIDVLNSVKFYRHQESCIVACKILGFKDPGGRLDIGAFVGMNLRNMMKNALKAKFTQRKGFTLEHTEEGAVTKKITQRVPFYYDGSEDGSQFSVLDIVPANTDTPESIITQAELLSVFFGALESKEERLIHFLLSDDEGYLFKIKEEREEKLKRVENGEKYVRISRGANFTLDTLARYMGIKQSEAEELILQCREKFEIVVGI